MSALDQKAELSARQRFLARRADILQRQDNRPGICGVSRGCYCEQHLRGDALAHPIEASPEKDHNCSLPTL